MRAQAPTRQVNCQATESPDGSVATLKAGGCLPSGMRGPPTATLHRHSG